MGMYFFIYTYRLFIILYLSRLPLEWMNECLNTKTLMIVQNCPVSTYGKSYEFYSI